MSTERETREAEHQAAIVQDVRHLLYMWRSGGADPEDTLRLIAKRTGYYVAGAALPAVLRESGNE